MEKLVLYIEVNQLRRRGFKIAAISKKLGISRNTVYKYLEMSFDEATDWVSTLNTRRKKLDPYRDIILTWLKEHPDLSSAQIEDWLKKKNPAIAVGSSDLRDTYHIPKVIRIRDHMLYLVIFIVLIHSGTLVIFAHHSHSFIPLTTLTVKNIKKIRLR
ncbi:helix-turn-helix domain-containing protein [Sutcliffiella cohnii]